MASVAGCALEWSWMADQVAASGVQTHEAACCALSSGGLLVAATQRGSMAPTCMCCPFDSAWMAGELSEKVTVICQEVAEESRQMIVGCVMPGGKMEPCSG